MANIPPHLHLPAPVIHYMVCRGAGKKPLEYIGDWPRRGMCYPCTIRPHFETGEPHVYIHGFYANPPYGAFKRWRFRLVAEVWLN